MNRIFQQDGITIVSVSENVNSVASLGVTKYGNSEGEPFRADLGVNIATNRAKIQPWSSIKNNRANTFNNACNLIVNHINNQKQVELKNLVKNR